MSLNKKQDLLGQLAGEYLVDVVNKPTPGNTNAERAIVQAKWTKSLGGLVMEGHLHDAVSGESQCLLATFDAREKAYRLWLLPRKGEPMRAAGVFDEIANVLTWKFTASDGARTELLWKFDGPDRCDWTMKKWDKAGTLLSDSEWTPRSRALPILPPPLKVPPDLDLPKIDDVKKVERNPEDLRRDRIFPHVSARADSTIRHRAVGIVAEEGLQQLEIELLSVAS